MAEKCNAVLMGRPERKRTLGRPRCRREDKNVMDLLLEIRFFC
jgi:hypothetical protein